VVWLVYDRDHGSSACFLCWLATGDGSELRRRDECLAMGFLAGSALACLYVADRRMVGADAARALVVRFVTANKWIVRVLFGAKSLGASLDIRSLGIYGHAAIANRTVRKFMETSQTECVNCARIRSSV